MRLLFILFGLLAVAVSTGCNAISRALPSVQEMPISASASIAPPPNPDVPYRIDILDSPRQLHSEQVYPPMIARHRIMWDGDGLDWRIRFPPGRYAYAACRLRRLIDVQAHVRRMRLAFNIRPARSCAFLSVALVDRPLSGLPVLSDVPLRGRAPPLGDGWTRVSIPLADFPPGVPAESRDAALSDTSMPVALTTRDLEWSRIQEIRIISPGGPIPAGEISIRDIRFQRL